MCIFVISHTRIAECYSYFVWWPFTIKAWCVSRLNSLHVKPGYTHSVIKFTFVRNPHWPQVKACWLVYKFISQLKKRGSLLGYKTCIQCMNACALMPTRMDLAIFVQFPLPEYGLLNIVWETGHLYHTKFASRKHCIKIAP